MVPDKGCDLLIDALRLLRSAGLKPTLTVNGDGPERNALEQHAINSGLHSQILFAGKISGLVLARELNRHRVIVIPSRWNEPFGIVALEGMACGCFPVVSSGGGLPEATGGNGIVFQNGDVNELANAIKTAMDVIAVAVPDYSGHLENFKAAAVAGRYLHAFATAIQKR